MVEASVSEEVRPVWEPGVPAAWLTLTPPHQAMTYSGPLVGSVHVLRRPHLLSSMWGRRACPSKQHIQLGMVGYTSYCMSWEPKAGGLMSLRVAWARDKQKPLGYDSRLSS